MEKKTKDTKNGNNKKITLECWMNCLTHLVLSWL